MRVPLWLPSSFWTVCIGWRWSLKKPLCCFLGLPPSTVRPPPTVPYPIQIGALRHCFASNRFLTVGQSSSDASILQTGLKLPLAHFRYHATHIYPLLFSPSAT